MTQEDEQRADPTRGGRADWFLARLMIAAVLALAALAGGLVLYRLLTGHPRAALAILAAGIAGGVLINGVVDFHRDVTAARRRASEDVAAARRRAAERSPDGD